MPERRISGATVQIPEHRQIAAAFEHVDACGVKGEDRAADRAAIAACGEQDPVGDIDAMRRIFGAVVGKGVVIFDVRYCQRTFDACEPAEAVVFDRHVEDAVDLKRD